MKFSVIVPVYKVEDYLAECVESVLNQPYQDYELILVDDGSPDRCPALCDGYAAKDSRVRVIHQQNKGLSAARNTGIDAACGDYIFFLDSDDVFCAPAMTEAAKAIDATDGIDLLIGNYITWENGAETIHNNSANYLAFQNEKSALEICELYAADDLQLPWPAYNCAYNRRFLNANGLRFKVGLIGAEDLEFFLRAIPNVKSYRITPAAFVKYRAIREGSITTAPSLRSVTGQLEVYASAVKKADMFPNAVRMKQYFAYWYAIIINFIGYLALEDRRRCYRIANENRALYQSDEIFRFFVPRTLKQRIFKGIWRLFGLAAASEFLVRTKVPLQTLRRLLRMPS